MYLNDKATLLGGIALILLAICLVVFVGTSAWTSDKSPFEEDEVAQYLTDVNDVEELVFVGAAFGIIADGAVGLVAAALLYILFRDRSRLLALITLAGLLANSAVAMVTDGSTLLLTIIADDFVNGGPGDIPAGDPAVLEVGRLLGMTTFAFTNVSFTALGLGLLALGINLAYSPEGAINPPRAFGWIAIIAGLSAWLAWLVLAVDIAFIFFIVQGLASLILLIGLGVWLIQHRNLQPGVAAGMTG